MFWVYVFLALILLVQGFCAFMLVTIASSLLRMFSRMEEPPAPTATGASPAPDRGLVDIPPVPTYDPRFNRPA